jgi:hypothetical protein
MGGDRGEGERLLLTLPTPARGEGPCTESESDDEELQILSGHRFICRRFMKMIVNNE